MACSIEARGATEERPRDPARRTETPPTLPRAMMEETPLVPTTCLLLRKMQRCDGPGAPVLPLRTAAAGATGTRRDTASADMVISHTTAP